MTEYNEVTVKAEDLIDDFDMIRIGGGMHQILDVTDNKYDDRMININARPLSDLDDRNVIFMIAPRLSYFKTYKPK